MRFIITTQNESTVLEEEDGQWRTTWAVFDSVAEARRFLKEERKRMARDLEEKLNAASVAQDALEEFDNAEIVEE